MILELKRPRKGQDGWYEDGMVGSLYLNGKFECFTLEDTDRYLEEGGVKVYGNTAIPRGRYRIDIDWSDRHKCLDWHILAVPQFEGIRIDIANVPGEILGCIAVGTGRSLTEARIMNSTLAKKNLSIKMLKAIKLVEPIEIEIT